MKSPSVTHHLSPKLLATLVFTAVAGIGSSYAVAQAPTAADAQQRYQADVERCRSGQTSQDEQTCLREAGAALEEARRNRLVTGSPSFDENQRARCDRLTGTQRDDCMQLMTDPGATVHGSVEGGGVIRETTITIPADSTMHTPASGGLAPAPASNTMPAPIDSTQPGTTPPAYGTETAPYTPDSGAGGLTPAPAQ